LITAEIPQGVYSLDDLKELGQAKGWCPYFMTRHLIHHSNILVYNYQYMLDPKVSNLVSRDLEAESIVVFDEAHNIGGRSPPFLFFPFRFFFFPFRWSSCATTALSSSC
jgi:hypothetical protein